MTQSVRRRAVRAFSVVGIVAAASFAAPATVAQTMAASYIDDHNGAREIAAGDYGRAERVLLTSLSTSPTDPDLLLNLAALYAHNGRANEATALYRQVLSRPDEVLTVGNGSSMSSHDIAGQALSRINPVHLTAR